MLWYNIDMAKTPKQLERYFKGVANHHRVSILQLVKERENITLMAIAEELNMNLKTASVHTARLVAAGLINKKYLGSYVVHTISPFGLIMIDTISKF
jgi:predicted transcriptional regulator